jgi:hypothetical protein
MRGEGRQNRLHGSRNLLLLLGPLRGGGALCPAVAPGAAAAGAGSVLCARAGAAATRLAGGARRGASGPDQQVSHGSCLANGQHAVARLFGRQSVASCLSLVLAAAGRGTGRAGSVQSSAWVSCPTSLCSQHFVGQLDQRAARGAFYAPLTLRRRPAGAGLPWAARLYRSEPCGGAAGGASSGPAPAGWCCRAGKGGAWRKAGRQEGRGGEHRASEHKASNRNGTDPTDASRQGRAAQ